ncbi:HTTM domain-containing protein [Haloechinothrix sp. LS1_15]|uniref:HTTM domain-containing protein n=1 Tax=Haloechinothrix sp. LS1_15 TaxID=2652248 RepID=UPI00294B2292|nr:HTTM domain-containing protein [Haloechinothrix sp. LS1_15]
MNDRPPSPLAVANRITSNALGPYQTATLRIGIAATFLLLLLREWPNRHELYGPDGAFHHDLAKARVEATDSFTILVWSDNPLWFELGYLFAIAASVAMVLGWRVRAVAVLFMLAVLSVHNRNPVVGDGGNNLIHLMSIYLVASRCNQVWALDARRRDRNVDGADVTGVVLWCVLGLVLASVTLLGHLGTVWMVILWILWLIYVPWWWAQRRGQGELRTVLAMSGNLVHNGALLVIMMQMCLLYATAGWYKVQGTRWQDGTAVYYPLQVDAFNPWPALSGLLASHAVLILALTYGTVLLQVAFPFTLINRRVKNVVLVLLIAEHLGIAILLGLPFFSLAVIAGDLVFAPTMALRRVERAVMSALPGRSRHTAVPRFSHQEAAAPVASVVARTGSDLRTGH